jgi:RNA polymerase sigma-70 factor (ECF subfamily)
LADSIGLALLVVLDSLTPSERLAFVLHDMFDLPFEEIGSIIGCSSAAARQLASRARRRVQGVSSERTDVDLTQQKDIVEAFLAASRGGDIARLLSLLDPGVVLRADEVSVRGSAAQQNNGAPNLVPEARGPRAVVDVFAGKAKAARPALIDGLVGAAWAPGGVPRVLFDFRFRDGRIVSIDVLADPASVAAREIALLDE